MQLAMQHVSETLLSHNFVLAQLRRVLTTTIYLPAEFLSVLSLHRRVPKSQGVNSSICEFLLTKRQNFSIVGSIVVQILSQPRLPR